MRSTWDSIKDKHPDSWVLLREMEYNRGNLISAYVVYACAQFEGINRFELDNPNETCDIMAIKFTGQPVEAEFHYDGF